MVLAPKRMDYRSALKCGWLLPRYGYLATYLARGHTLHTEPLVARQQAEYCVGHTNSYGRCGTGVISISGLL